MKDLTDMLRSLEEKDRFYEIDATLIHLLAPQDPKTVRPYTYIKTGWGKIERVEAQEDGSPSHLTAPKRRKRTRTGEGETKSASCWSFAVYDGGITMPWGGSWGIFKTAWRRTLEAKADRYTNPKLDLIKIYPRKLFVKGKIDSMLPNAEPTVVLEKRNTQRGEVMVEAFFDHINDKKAKFYIEVDSENPINEEKFIGMLKSLNTLDSFGPSKRGEIRIDKIAQVKPSTEELTTLINN